MVIRDIIKNPKRMNFAPTIFDAKACTETSAPDLTNNIPKAINKKFNSPNATVVENSFPFIDVIIKQWCNAIPTSHGIKDIFSTGSKNQYPPQPSSL